MVRFTNTCPLLAWVGVFCTIDFSALKAISLALIILHSDGLSGQNDTTFINLHHTALEEVLVLDAWSGQKDLTENPEFKTLEIQLKKLSGINLISRGSFGQELVFRGQSDGRLQVRVNDMRVFNACTDRMDPSTSYVVANNLQAAELSSSCETNCASNGLVGSLNLQTKEARLSVTDTLKYGFAQSYQTNTNGFNSSFYLEQSKAKWAWRLNGSWMKNSNYVDGKGNEIAYSQNQKQNWSLNSIYRLSKTGLIRLDLIYDLATDIGYPSLPMDVSIARGIIGGLSFLSSSKLGPFRSFEFKIYHNDIYHEMDDTQREEVFMHMDMPGWSRTSGLLFKGNGWNYRALKLKFAAEYFTNFRRAEMTMFPDNGTDPPMFMFTWPDARLHGLGSGLSAHYQYDRSSFMADLRLDYEGSRITDEIGQDQWTGMGYDMSHRRDFICPQIKLSHQYFLDEHNSIESAIGYGSRAPTTSELYGFYLFNAHDGFDYLGNADLENEKLWSSELGHKFTGKTFNVQSSFYFHRYRNYIFGLNTNYDAMTYGANGVRGYDHLDQASFWGFEFKGDVKLNQKLKSSGKLEYTRGYSSESDLPLIPPLQANLLLSYQVAKLNFNTQIRYAAEQSKFNSDYGDRYTPSYALVDASINYRSRFRSANILISLSANNLLDAQYREHLSWAGIPGIGRNIVLGIQFGI